MYINNISYINSDKSEGYTLVLKKSKPLIYDPKTNKFFGRTLVDWIKFLALFFGCLLSMIGLFVAMFFAFTEGVINEDRPFRTGHHSALNNEPSLSFRPLIDFKTALIKYADADPSTYMSYIQNMRALLLTYEDAGLISEDSYATCIDGKKTPDDVNRPCKFDLTLLHQCRQQFNFGYDRTKPCVILKLNKMYGWVPDVINSSVSKDILISCQGQNTEDIEYFPGVFYYPNVTINGVVYGFFNNLYYPYLTQYGYRQPLLAVQLNQPKKNVILMARCRIVNLITPSYPLTFEILVD